MKQTVEDEIAKLRGQVSLDINLEKSRAKEAVSIVRTSTWSCKWSDEGVVRRDRPLQNYLPCVEGSNCGLHEDIDVASNPN